jgi:1-phosphofructokinase family hexose kinase
MIYTITLNPAVDRELTVPAIQFDSVLRATAWRVDVGGKGFNVSRMLHALGADSVALGFAGGRAGELLQDGLHTLGIETDFIWVEGETRTNVSIVAAEQARYVKVNEPGPTITAVAQDALLEKVGRRAAAGDWWVLAGSLPPGVPATIYADLTAVIQNAGARVILDSSGEALRHGCAARPFLVKPNEVEVGQLTGLPVGSPEEVVAAARAVHGLGVTAVVVSLGKRGALLVAGEQVWQAAPPTIRERNPIGAGDSMVGGLVWALSQDLPLPDALRWGMACGAATAAREGTAVGDLSKVQSLATQVQLRET